MANNRMFLVHRPTGKAVMLGKRMGHGWYRPGFNEQPDPLAERIQRLFDLAEAATIDMQRDDWDDFALAAECAEGPSGAITNWIYDGEAEDGIYTLWFTTSEPAAYIPHRLPNEALEAITSGSQATITYIWSLLMQIDDLKKKVVPTSSEPQAPSSE